jgi:hypothetical protein
VNALAKDEVGEFVNRYFVSSFQRVGTFRITNSGQKQGGNVAAYFCAPDGRVLHIIAGPVNDKAFLEEAKWVVLKAKDAITESKGDAAMFKQLMRRYHAERLEEQYGVRVTPVFKDQIFQTLTTAVAYRDAEGRHLAPVLPLPPIENQKQTKNRANQKPAKNPNANMAKVHRLLAAHAMMKIEGLYGAVFEGILGEKVTTKPVQGPTPFPGK